MARIQYGCVSSRAGEATGLLAKFFNLEINGLADRFLMESKENVNPRMEKGQFSKIPFYNRKNMQSHIVVCYSRQM
jgi:hypothetical protein